jgi:two-component system, NarL family, nitrate/nitrite response regulator NarL
VPQHRAGLKSKPMRTTSIVVADDHPVVLHGIVTLLRNDERFKIVAICTNGQESVEAIRNFSPDLALLDINMPELNGLDVLKAVKEARIETRVIFLAAAPSDNQIIVARESGAFGIMLKEEAADTLLGCLHAVANGQKWYPAELLSGALERTKEHRSQIAKVENLLTRREIEVMLRVANGLSNKDVGNQLNISEGTVKIHLNNIYHKIGINNRTALANFAIAYRERLTTEQV